MINYLRLKLDQNDMHGVADAAMDIRDLDSEMLGVQRGIDCLTKDI